MKMFKSQKPSSFDLRVSDVVRGPGTALSGPITPITPITCYGLL